MFPCFAFKTNRTRRQSRGRRAAATGRRGERHAARALKRRGYRILARRWRTPAGEIDLLAEDRGGIIVVEVKATRSASAPLGGRVDHKQRQRLRAARRYVGGLATFRGRRVRIDLALVRWTDHGVVVKVHQNVYRGTRDSRY